MRPAWPAACQDDGATYNIYAEGSQAARVWPLELLPMLIGPGEWAQIERGIVQRARMLNAVLADVYGQRTLLDGGLLPPSLVLAHPQYLRALHGCVPPGGVHLHIAAFDLARGPDGLWWVLDQRTQAPSGLGYLLENRLIIGQQFPEAFRDLRVQRLASSFQVLLQGLLQLSPAGERSRVVLLTPRAGQRDLLRAGVPGPLPRHHAGGRRRPHRARQPALPQDPARAGAGACAAAPGGRRIPWTLWS